MSPGATTNRFREFARRSHEVIVLAAITGVVTGFAVAAFDRIVVEGILDHLFELSPWLLAFMPLVGLTLSWLALCYVARFARLGHDRPLPQGVPRSRPAVAGPRVPRTHARGDRHARVRWRHGPRGRVALPGIVLRLVPPGPVPALHRGQQPAGADGRGCGRRGRRHLQGAGDGRDLRARGAVPGRPGAPHAAARAGRVGIRLPGVRRGERHHAALRRARRTATAFVRGPRRRARARRGRRASARAGSRGCCVRPRR